MNRDMLVRQNHADESNHPLDNEHDNGGPRDQTYADPSLNRSGSRSTRSHHHVTGKYSVNLGEGVNPPMYIFSSKAKNPQIKTSWAKNFGTIRGRWGHKELVDLPCLIASRPNGSMDTKLFQQFIEMVSLIA